MVLQTGVLVFLETGLLPDDDEKKMCSIIGRRIK